MSLIEQAYSMVGIIVVALGGGTVVALGIIVFASKLLEKKLGETFRRSVEIELDRHRASLRKSEFVFQRQYDAVNAFIRIRRDFAPRWIRPEMDWEDALAEMAGNVSEVRKTLSKFVGEFGAVLPVGIISRLEHISAMADQNGYFDDEDTPSKDSIEAAEEVYNTYREIETELHSGFVDQHAAPK